MSDMEINVLDRIDTPAGLMFTVRDNNQYRVGQRVRYNGNCYKIIGISINNTLNLTGLTVIKA